MKFILKGLINGQKIVVTWNDGQVSGPITDALHLAARLTQGKSLGHPPGEACTEDGYFTNPEAFLELVAMAFPGWKYVLKGDDPFEKRIRPGVILSPNT